MPEVVLPSLRQPLPRVASSIDTSGSMSDGMLGQALGEVGGVLRSIGIARRDLRVVCCDAEAYEAQTVRDLGKVTLRRRRRHRHAARRRGRSVTATCSRN